MGLRLNPPSLFLEFGGGGTFWRAFVEMGDGVARVVWCYGIHHDGRDCIGGILATPTCRDILE
jgi:hypothetical protein